MKLSAKRSGSRRGSGIFYGWWIVLAAVALNIFNGGAFTFGFSLFIDPLSETFGWSRSAISAIWSGALLFSLICGPLVGMFIDRYGGRRMVWIGMPIFGLSYILMTQIESYLVFFVVVVVGFGIGLAAGINAPGEAEIAYWFRRKRAFALGIATAGSGIAGLTLVPGIGWVIADYGWQTAAVLLGVVTILCALPIGWVLKGRPEDHGQHVDGIPEAGVGSRDGNGVKRAALPNEPAFTAREALRMSVFWLLNLAFAMRWLGVAMVTVHQVPYLVNIGFTATEAATVLGASAALTVPSRLLFGWLGDRTSIRTWLIITYILQGLALVVLMYAGPRWTLYLYVVLFGFGAAAWPLGSALIGEYFGRQNYATIQGSSRPLAQGGRVVGAMLGGVVFDITGRYEPAFLLTAIALFIGVVLLFAARPPSYIPSATTAPSSQPG